MKRIITVKRWNGAAFILVLITISALLLGFNWPGRWDPIREVLIKGADLHLSRQGTYINACGGAYGPPDVLEIENTWEWEIESGNTCWNVGGISATGLLAAYERTGYRDYLDGAIAQGDTLVKKYHTIVTDDPEGAEWEDRPFSQDIEFLVRLSQYTQKWRYRRHKDDDDLQGRCRHWGHADDYFRIACQWYGIVTNNKTAEETADRYIDARKSLAGWDLASQIRAALAIGEWQYALGIASRLLERRSDWEGELYSGYDFTITSYTSLLWAFGKLRFGSRDIHKARREFLESILEAQDEDGSWSSGDYQDTAYAILGLDTCLTPRSCKIRKALGKAFAYLRDTQTTDGGWSYPPEYGEINSEILMALGGLYQWEISRNPDDPPPGNTQKPTITPIQ